LIRAKKSLGQNFLSDASVARRIIDAASPSCADVIIEIGPGTGSLTRMLVERVGFVVAVEVDSRLTELLRREIRAANLSVVKADALSLNWNELIDEARSKSVALSRHDSDLNRVRVLANLPYYISTPIIERLFSVAGRLFDMTLMLQKEVADRITSGPGGREYGYLSVLVQYHSIATKLLEVPPAAFTPAPKVQSAVINLKMRTQPPVEVANERKFFRFVQLCFAQRRKTILNNLKAAAASSAFATDVESALEAASVSSQRRAETLSLEEFAALCESLYRD
jgi:16S rRNA (adenine1518-N6/adenine1519-N6)-dimethyltransferase